MNAIRTAPAMLASSKTLTVKPQSIPAAVLTALRSQPAQVRAATLALAIGIDLPTVVWHLASLCGRGLAQRTASGLWSAR